MREQILFSIFLEDTGMKEHVMKLNYPKTFKRIIVLFILLAVIAWLYKSAVNEKMNKSLWADTRNFLQHLCRHGFLHRARQAGKSVIPALIKA